MTVKSLKLFSLCPAVHAMVRYNVSSRKMSLYYSVASLRERGSMDNIRKAQSDGNDHELRHSTQTGAWVWAWRGGQLSKFIITSFPRVSLRSSVRECCRVRKGGHPATGHLLPGTGHWALFSGAESKWSLRLVA